MPRATASAGATERVELKSCPGGFVVLRRMTFGEFQERQKLAMTPTMKTNGDMKTAVMDIGMDNVKVAEYEFSHCIVDHNLEDDDGNLLDFKNRIHVHLLDTVIGNEIAEAIEKFHEVNPEGNSVPG